MSKVSQEAFNSILISFKEFELLSKLWFDNEDVTAAAKARSYGKRIMGDIKLFIDATVTEATKVVPRVTVVAKKEVTEEVVTLKDTEESVSINEYPVRKPW